MSATREFRKWSDCTGDPCTCPRPDANPPPLPRPLPLPMTEFPAGWRCPDCRHVYGPDVKECSRCPRTLGQRLSDAHPKPVRLSRESREGDIR